MNGKDAKGSGDSTQSEATDGYGRKWKRLGACAKCGRCCSDLRFTFKEQDIYVKDFVEFYKARGVTVFKSQYMKDTWVVLVPNRCQHLGAYNLCKIQKEKPLSCRIQPIGPESHENLNCSFRWKELEGGT